MSAILDGNNKTTPGINGLIENHVERKKGKLFRNAPSTEVLGFDPQNIIEGPPVYIRRQLYYQAYASTTFSIEQATNLIDYIGTQVDSDDCLPFAVKLIENDEIIAVAEDNGEFGCGAVLSRCLKRLDGFNVLVCVARKVKGAFVADMVQSQKLHAVKEAADKALELLHKQLTGSDLGREENDINLNQSNVVVPPSYDRSSSKRKASTKK